MQIHNTKQIYDLVHNNEQKPTYAHPQTYKHLPQPTGNVMYQIRENSWAHGSLGSTFNEDDHTEIAKQSKPQVIETLLEI